MSEYLIRGFRAQLTTSMDSVLRRAVFEIMTIFENSLHDHQMELVQKGEEVAQLKMKLQRAEIRLSEIERGGDRATEMKNGRTEDVVNAPEQTVDLPEIDFEVPDDWCAPLGCETVTKREDLCPSVRLRRLSIPLWPISIIKQEVVQRDIDTNQRTQGLRRSRRCSSLNEKHKNTQDRTLPTRRKGTCRPPLRNNMKTLLQVIKQEPSDITSGMVLRSRGRNFKGKKQGNTKKSKREERKIAATKSDKKETVKNDSEKYSCSLCKKVFDTMFGRNVHLRSHKNRRESSIQKDGHNKKHSCVHCDKTCSTSWNLKEHMSLHTCERRYLCSMCPKKYRSKQSLKKHKMKMHIDQITSRETNENHAWTKPLELSEDNCEDLKSPSKETRRANNHKDVPRDRSPDTSPSSNWQTMGRRCPEGFICLLCPKLSKNIHQLIEHFCTHTGEKPIKCDDCSATFRFLGQLSVHKKQGCNLKTQCAQCKKTFRSKKKYTKHVLNCRRDHRYFCKVCGKGFFLKGHFRNHMERLHK